MWWLLHEPCPKFAGALPRLQTCGLIAQPAPKSLDGQVPWCLLGTYRQTTSSCSGSSERGT
eukprot:1514385-Prorocentrum_lima.AAC.1